MNLISTNQPLTMSSQEMAELTNTRHDSVKRTAKLLQQKGLIGNPQIVEKPTAGRPVDVFYFDKRDSLVLVARLSPEFTAAIVDRWQELENAAAPKVPQTYAEALQLAADQAKQLEAAKPAVEFVERYVEAGNAVSIREAAKRLQYKERSFIECLQRDKYLYRLSGNLAPYASDKTAELFEVKTGERNGHTFTQTRVTPAGIAKFAQVYATELGE